ncbi:unnamed protein product [Adineta steineri]|uniref:Uncharacterized protein n=1 Tax=Adineta steineri TaxID=433720 RepID=A0A815TH78_9BILA|nr:unnamed protein product [Adineta steineri]CAF4100590.1 unnamed protein product [Adineta steineri]
MNSKAPKELQTIDDDDDEEDEDKKSDQPENEEPILDIIKNHEKKQFELQQNEFRTRVVSLQEKFKSLAASDKDDSYEQLQQLYEQLQREMKHWKTHLPIYSRRIDILELIQKNQIFILKADTGSGKSTQVVQYLWDAGFAQKEQILCTQPRKLAVYTLASRVAEEYGCMLGEEVGCCVGGKRSESASDKTKIKFVTDTVLLKEYQNDQLLQNYSVVIIDAVHERKIDTDLALGIMKQCLEKRKDLKLIVMSATLDTDLLYNYFSNGFLNSCGLLEIAGRNYPIEDTYLDDDVENYVKASVAKAVEIHQKKESGDILVFLTSQEEIGSAINELKQKLGDDKHYIALSLHGHLPEEETEYIFKKIPDKRKIIFSTNIAETSVTINGIQHVIDTGMFKTKMWDPERKIQVLKVGLISQSSVKQRRGRAGRTSPGKCYHLYTVERYQSMDPYSPAEILCTQPLLAILKLKSLGFNDINSFKWIESPPSRDLHEANDTLIWLNALNDQHNLTGLGKEMVRLDIDPRLTAMLHKAKGLKCLSEVLIIAGMLTVSQNIWWRSKGEDGKRAKTEAREGFIHERGDHITFLILYQKWSSFSGSERKAQYDWCRSNYINAKSLQIANNFIGEVSKQMNYEMIKVQDLNQKLIDRILQCIIAGYFQNLAVSNGSLRAGYRVIPTFQSASENLLNARVFLDSALALKNQMPQYICYNELVNLNGMNYITTLFSVNPIWLHSVSQQWYKSANIDKIHLITYVSFTFTNQIPVLMKAVFNKHNCKLDGINKIIKGMVEIDYLERELTIWCQKSNLDNAKKIIEKMLNEGKPALSDEQEEIKIIGRTRIVMGNGGKTKMVLVENECIRIILTMLPATITEERINELCEPYGRVHDICCLQQTNKSACFAVTYHTPDEAQRALKGLNCHVEQGCKISVGGTHLKSNVPIRKQDFALRAVWYLTPSLRIGKIIFTDKKDALVACRLFRDSFYNCRYETSDDLPKLEVTYYRGLTNRAEIKFQTKEQVQEVVKQMQHTMLGSKKINCARGQDSEDNPFVKVTNLPGDTDEEDIRDHFKSYKDILKEKQLHNYTKDIFVRRQKWENTATSQTSDFGLAALQKKFSKHKDFHSTPTYHLRQPTSDGIVMAYIFFDDPGDVGTSIRIFNNTEIQLPGYKSNLRLIPSTVHEIPIYSAVAKAISGHIQRAVKSIKEEFHNQLHIKVVKSATDNAPMKVGIEGDNIEQIRTAKMKFETILKGKEYTWTDHPEKIQIFFNRAGENVLLKIQNKTGCYIWRNVSNSFIRLFGSDKACELAKDKIDEYIKCALINSKYTITVKIPSNHWAQIRSLTSTDQEFVEKKNDVELSFLSNQHHQIRLTGTKSHVLDCENIINKWLTTFSIGDHSSFAPTADCSVCLYRSEYRLQICGHPFCYQCLQIYLSKYFSGVQAEIQCPKDNCGSLLLLRDIKIILRRVDDGMKKLATASLNAYIITDEDLIRCPGDKASSH